jgi:hypothetical protein
LGKTLIAKRQKRAPETAPSPKGNFAARLEDYQALNIARQKYYIFNQNKDLFPVLRLAKTPSKRVK